MRVFVPLTLSSVFHDYTSISSPPRLWLSIGNLPTAELFPLFPSFIGKDPVYPDNIPAV
jgi:hypothetical protein